MYLESKDFERYRPYVRGEYDFKQQMFHILESDKIKSVLEEGVLFVTPKELETNQRTRSLLLELVQPEAESAVLRCCTLYTMKAGCINAAL